MEIAEFEFFDIWFQLTFSCKPTLAIPTAILRVKSWLFPHWFTMSPAATGRLLLWVQMGKSTADGLSFIRSTCGLMFAAWAPGLSHISVLLDLSTCVRLNSRITSAPWALFSKVSGQHLGVTRPLCLWVMGVYTNTRSEVILGWFFFSGACTYLSHVCVCVCVCKFRV